MVLPVLNFGKVNNVLMGVEYEMQNVGCADARFVLRHQHKFGKVVKNVRIAWKQVTFIL